jgi:hypothetical protein
MSFGLMELHKSLEDLAFVTYYWKREYMVHFAVQTKIYNMVTIQHTPTLINLLQNIRQHVTDTFAAHGH